ncbi:MAG: hypothetical protein EZS28_013541 [Streblomastix strix]|uniref:Uncharacterized protein n=1 Tax=Streblomastix strix TaxID=222440 RepID=A0A5J4W8J6_9EUKA|nr:MAG: hypothetical protein EZS28_013541 [Streblomastix strix]
MVIVHIGQIRQQILFKKNNIDFLLLLPSHTRHGFLPLDLSISCALKLRVKQMQKDFEKGINGHQTQHAVIASLVSTSFFSNSTALRKGEIALDCTQKPAIVTIDELRFQYQMEKVLC